MSSQRLISSSQYEIDAALSRLKAAIGECKNHRAYQPRCDVRIVGEAEKLVTLDFECTFSLRRDWLGYVLVPLLVVLIVAWILIFHADWVVPSHKDFLIGTMYDILSNVLAMLPVVAVGYAYWKLQGVLLKDAEALSELELEFWAPLSYRAERDPILLAYWPSTPRSAQAMLVIQIVAWTAIFWYLLGFTVPTVVITFVALSGILADIMAGMRMSATSFWKYERLNKLLFFNTLFWILLLAWIAVALCSQVLSAMLDVPLDQALHLQMPLDKAIAEEFEGVEWFAWLGVTLGLVYFASQAIREVSRQLIQQWHVLGNFKHKYAQTVQQLRAMRAIGYPPIDLTRSQRLAILVRWLMYTLSSWALIALAVLSVFSYLGAGLVPSLFPSGPIFALGGSVILTVITGGTQAYVLYRQLSRAYTLATYPRKLLCNQGAYRTPEKVTALLGDLCQKADLPLPQIVLVNDKSIDAQVFGPTPWSNNYVLELTVGSVLNLDEDELSALIAHEIGHIKFDHRFRLLYMLSAVSMAGISFLNALVDYAEREFAADEFAVRLLGSGCGLKRLITKLDETDPGIERLDLSTDEFAIGTGLNRVITWLVAAKDVREKDDSRRILKEEWSELVQAFFHNQLPFYFHPTASERLDNIEVASGSSERGKILAA